jgi:hypothetical protein
VSKKFLKKRSLKDSETVIGLVSIDDITHGYRGYKLIKYLKLLDNEYTKKRPSKCKVCQLETITGIYLLGARDGILYWQCNECRTDYLRYTVRTTEKYLQKATKVYTNPQDWQNFPDDSEVQ